MTIYRSERRRLLIVSCLAFGFALLSTFLWQQQQVRSARAAATLAKITAPKPFDPLQLPTQTVNNRVSGIAGPAVSGSANLSVTGTKCNRDNKAVHIHGVVSWITVDPPGTAITIGGGSSLREPGCVTKTFVNPVPSAVFVQTRKLNASGYPHVRWKITGIETPDGPRSVARTWLTEAFTVLP